jgi:hypothetical protein
MKEKEGRLSQSKMPVVFFLLALLLVATMSSSFAGCSEINFPLYALALLIIID